MANLVSAVSPYKYIVANGIQDPRVSDAIRSIVKILQDTHKDLAGGINTLSGLDALKAPIASPAFTGVPTAPTAAPLTNNTQIATTAYTDLAIVAAIASIIAVPAGTIIDFAGTSAPTGYLACPTASGGAQVVSRTTYAALFAAIGTTWGAGDGSTTFGIPWFAADYAAVQANANVGTSSVGVNLTHSHTTNSGVVSGGGGTLTAGAALGFGSATASTMTPAGGAANLAAGVRTLKCVKT